MTPPATDPLQRSSAVRRYGPLLAVAVVALMIVALTSRSDPTAPSAPNVATSGVTTTPIGFANVPLTYEEAKAKRQESSIPWVANCDPATGRVKVPSVYAPPCVPAFSGDNGGATGAGVTSDTITVVYYLPPNSNDLTAALTTKPDPPDVASASRDQFVEMFSKLFATYGRKIKLVDFEASGGFDDVTAARADAVSVAERYHPFASIGGPLLATAYADELATHHILCVGCFTGTDQFYQDHAPYVWGTDGSPDELAAISADFISKRLVGRNATFAGDEYKQSPRVFALVHVDSNPPQYGELQDRSAQCSGTKGWQPKLIEAYLFSIGDMPTRAATIVAKLKSEGITSVIIAGDPIMPIYLTKQATQQDYHPEWIVMGSPFADINAIGRTYDAKQWSHAFGLGALPVRVPRDQTDAWRLHQWYFGTPPTAPNSAPLSFPGLQQLFTGIHLAGPRLDASTFRDGLFHYPPSGGGPTAPRISYGNRGVFACLSDTPKPDYLATDDLTEIWWDATATGPDEQGNTSLPGMWRYANQGKRYQPKSMPVTDAAAFIMANSVTTFDQIPVEDRAPSYPSPDRN